MATIDKPSQEQADLEEVLRLSAKGKKVTDPDLLQRIQVRFDWAKAQSKSRFSFGTQAIRETRGPIDEEQERELTLAQMDLLRRGDARLVDPETGEAYVLVPVVEYERLCNRMPTEQRR
jgi:hypothetical protein